GVAFGHLAGRANQEVLYYVVAQAQFPGAAQVVYARQRDGSGQWQRLVHVERVAFWYFVATRQPQRQVSTRRMAQRYHTVEVKVVFGGQFADVRRAQRHVLERAGPASARVADA